VRRCLVRAMYLSATEVAVSTWGAISSARPLPIAVAAVQFSAVVSVFAYIFLQFYCDLFFLVQCIRLSRGFKNTYLLAYSTVRNQVYLL